MLIELVVVLCRRKIDIAFLWETKWRGGSAKELGEEYKLLCLGADEIRMW